MTTAQVSTDSVFDATANASQKDVFHTRLLQNGECLQGTVNRPYIKENRLLGAVLSFEGRSETALLHVKQVGGLTPAERLADLEMGEAVRVRITVSSDKDGRKVWASERGLEHQEVLDVLNSTPEKMKDLPGVVHSITEFGVFIELSDGLAKGHRGLLRFGSKGARVKLGAYISFNVGQSVSVDVTEASIDDTSR
jgi:ribosomal protein S1